MTSYPWERSSLSRSRITYFRSPFSNIRPRRGPWPNPGLCHPPKNPFIPFGPNMLSNSFRKRFLVTLMTVCQPTPVLLPERVSQPSLVRPYLYVTALRQIGEHPVRLGNGQRSLQRRQRGRELSTPRERLQELPLLALLCRHPARALPRPGLGKPRQAPRNGPERRHHEERNGPDEKEKGEEMEAGTGHEEQKQPPDHQPHHEPRRKGPPVRDHHPPPTRVAHHAPTVHLASSVPTASYNSAVYHDIS